MKIPISRIHPNPNNPRKLIIQEMTDDMARSLDVVGLKNSVKVCPDGKGDYELISGHVRLLGAQKLGWTEIEAIVLENLTEEEKMDIAMLDNRGQQTFWLDLYIWIEARMAKNPNLTQKQVADRVATTQSYVSCAIKALSLLNKSAREAIYRISINSSGKMPTEAAILALTDLAQGQLDDKDKVEQALKVVLDRQMTEKEVKKLVDWIRKGNTPESFPKDAKINKAKGSKNQRFDPNDPNAGHWAKAPKNIQVHKKPHGYQMITNLSEPEALMAFYSTMAGLKRLELKQRPGQAGNGNEFEDALPSIYDNAMGMAQEAQSGENKFKVQGSNAGSGVSDSTGVPSLLTYIMNMASAGTPRHISGKILKWIVMGIFGRLEGRKIGGMAKAKADNPSDSTGVPSLPKHTIRKTVLIAVAVAAGVFVLGYGLMKLIVPAMHPNNTQSITTQKQVNNIVPVADTNAGESDATISKSNDAYIKSSERAQAIKYYKGDEYSNAFLWFGKALDKYGPQAEIYFYMGYCEDSLGNHKEAQEFFEDYLKIYPNDEKIKAKIEELKSTVAPPDGLEVPTQESK